LLAADSPERLVGDQERFRLVLHQLLHAALKLARPGQVRVTIQAAGNHGLGAQHRGTESGRWPAHVAVVVSEATGLAGEQPESWFKAAASGSDADAEVELGLACARRLIEFMGGRIWAQKEGIDGLSLRFRVSLVAAEPAEPPGGPLQPSAPEIARGPGSAISQIDRDLGARVPARILLVDDDAINRKVGARMLAKMGYQVDVATGADEAITAIRQTPYDLVFTDIQMPGMSGTEAAQLYREADQAAGRSRLAPLMIIALTANALAGDRERYLAAGMDEYIAKPVRPATLQEVILAWGQRRDQAAASLGQAPGTSTEPGLDASPVDLDRLNDLAFGDQAILKETVTLYLTETASRLALLRQAIAQQDVATVFSLAHSVVGSSATLGAKSLIPPLKLLEQCGRSGTLGDAPQLLEKVEQEFGRTRVVLTEFVRDRPGPAR
jgi:CheY-like chemotaxis protein